MANGQQDPKMTYEQIAAHVKELDLAEFEKPQAAGMGDAQADLAGKLQQVCKIYKGIRPIIQAILDFPLIPNAIKKPLRTFMNVMDTICP